MAAATSGLRSAQSDASYASRRIAANLRLIVDGDVRVLFERDSVGVTTFLLKASLGSEQYQSMNSRMAWSYERFELEDVRLFKTADLDCSNLDQVICGPVSGLVCVCSFENGLTESEVEMLLHFFRATHEREEKRYSLLRRGSRSPTPGPPALRPPR